MKCGVCGKDKNDHLTRQDILVRKMALAVTDEDWREVEEMCWTVKREGGYPKFDGEVHTVFKYPLGEWEKVVREYCPSAPVQWCNRYDTWCPKENFCPALKNVRGGDFGWGECISRRDQV